VAALAQAPVEWSVQLQGDVLIIDAKTAAAQPAQRASAAPAYLEVAFPKAKLAGAAVNKPIDRGLVQKVQTLQDGDNALVRVFVLTKPKATLTKTATGYRYAIRMSEPAGSPSASAPKAPVKPPATSSQPRAATPPPTKTPPAATTPPPAKTPPVATAPPAATPPVAATPPQAKTPVVAATPPMTSPASGRDPNVPISVVFQNKPLLEAIKELADKAGYTAQLDPKLNGVVNLSLSDVPFVDALSMLLEPFGDGVRADVGISTITVAKVDSTPPPAATAGPLVSEYYPFSTKDAQKMMDAAKKAIPELSYRVDPVLNILLVQGPREDVVRLGELLKSMSNK
jgi:hypothetical protein